MLFPIPCFPSVLTSITAHRKLNSSHLVSQLPIPKVHIDQSVLSPRLLYGETTQGFVTTNFKSARATYEQFSRDDQSAAQIRLLL